MDAKEYLEENNIQLGETEEGHDWMITDDTDLLKQFTDRLESYHQAKSKEGAEERYKAADEWLSQFCDNSTSDYRNFKRKALRLAAFGKGEEG